MAKQSLRYIPHCIPYSPRNVEDWVIEIRTSPPIMGCLPITCHCHTIHYSSCTLHYTHAFSLKRNTTTVWKWHDIIIIFCSTAWAYQKRRQYNKLHARGQWKLTYSWLSDNHLEIHRNAYHLASFDRSWSCYKPAKAPFTLVYYGYYWTGCGLEKW